MVRKTSISAFTAALAALVAAALARNLTPLTRHVPLPELLDSVVHNLVLGVGILIASWYFLTASALLLTSALRLLGNSPARLEQLTSRLGAPLLRKVVTWTTVSTVAFSGPALAATGEEPGPVVYSPAAATESSEAREAPGPRNSAFLVDLGWIITSTGTAEAADDNANTDADDADDAGGSGPARPALDADSAHDAGRDQEYVVRAGDTLWGIAAQHLRRGSEHVTAAQIAAHWPRWYATNAETIGPDPDLITPGMTLHAPTETP